MKIIYHINSIYNPGGMERVTLNKATWLLEKGWDVLVVTTDQKGRPSFYNLPDGLRTADLGIDYSDDVGKGIATQTLGYFRRRRLHRKRLASLLEKERADIVVSLYPGESSFIPSINDGSRKILELHQNKFFHRQYANKGLKGLADRLREFLDERMVRRFDRFVVLTEEDRGYWGNLPNMVAIPNAAVSKEGNLSDCSTKRVIAVGRLDYQKSFDRLVDAWAMVCSKSEGWVLDIFGKGEWKDMLQSRIDNLGIADRCHLAGATSDIWSEYSSSSIAVMSSHYEGFPMAMVEAMACALPVVSFDFKTGPRDIIEDGKNGILVKDGDIEGLAQGLLRLMEDDGERVRMGACAHDSSMKYSQESVMAMWESVFKELLEDE